MTVLPELPLRPEDAHKGVAGRVIVIAGSLGMSGAGCLASLSALRSGAGLVTWAVPRVIKEVAEIKVTETITLPVPATENGQFGISSREVLSEASHEADAAVLGPGISAYGETGELLRLLIPEVHAPLVLDAGGLDAIAGDFNPVRKRRLPAVLTPHPGEMARLFGVRPAEVQEDREGFAKKLAKETSAVCLLKGRNTLVTDGEKVYENHTGNSGMATAGAGDVLAGIIAGLIAQGTSVYDAACLGAHLHGAAGDIAARELGLHGLIAGDILENIPAAFKAYDKIDN